MGSVSDLRHRFSQLSDDELIDVVTVCADDYENAALAAARAELEARGITPVHATRMDELSTSERWDFLLANGVPSTFVETAISNDFESAFPGFISRGPNELLARELADVEQFDGHEIWPLLELNHGQTYLVLLVGKQTTRFVRLDTEECGISEDYGSSFQLALADLVIDLYQTHDTVPREEIIRVATELGFKTAERLLDALDSIDRSTWKTLEEWQAVGLRELLEES